MGVVCGLVSGSTTEIKQALVALFHYLIYNIGEGPIL